MGGFHQKILYKRHNIIGYKDWLVDAGTIAQGSSSQAFEGRHYFRSMRIHKEAFDALVQHRVEHITDNFNSVNRTLLSMLKELRISPSSDTIHLILSSKEFSEFFNVFKIMTDTRSQMSIQYLRDISVMLSIVSALREG